MAWTHEDVASCANELRAGLPASLMEYILSPDFKGSDLVNLENQLSRPSSAEVALNAVWIRPFVRRYPDRVCSGFFIVDVLLEADKKMKHRLLVPREEGQNKMALANIEACRIKKLIGSLRYLWRSSFLVVYLIC